MDLWNGVGENVAIWICSIDGSCWLHNWILGLVLYGKEKRIIIGRLEM